MRKIIIPTLLACTLLTACKNDVQELAIVAHRGFWNCPEAGYSQNSIASLRCAQEAGFWGSEMDVQLTSDDSLVVFHDAGIGSVRICENPYDSIADHRLPNGEKIPSLDEYLTQAEKCKSTVLVFEIKETTCSERNIRLTDFCIEALKRHGLYSPERVVFISFCPDVNEHLGKVAPEFMTETLWKHYDTPQQYLEKNIRGADLNSGEYDKDTTLCANLKAAGLKTNVWTVDNPDKIAEYARMGIDELTTNVPDEAREIITGLGIKEKQL